jgi:hypothetical protein
LHSTPKALAEVIAACEHLSGSIGARTAALAECAAGAQIELIELEVLMQKATTSQFRKSTIVPLHYCGFEMKQQNAEYQISEVVSVRSLEGILSADNFSLWRENLSEKERTGLANVRIGIVNNFESSGHLGREENDSKELLHRIFACLRLIKPTRNAYSAIQFKWVDEHKVDVFSFTHPSDQLLNLPHAEVLNVIRPDDLRVLREIVQPFLAIQYKGPSHLRRAIRFYEEGYSDIQDAVLQIIVWVIGIKNALSPHDNRAVSRDQLLKGIEKYVGLNSNIYQDSWLGDPDYRETPYKSERTVGSSIDDLLTLYDRFTGGIWIPRDWEGRPSRRESTGEQVPFADSLRDVASFVLRKLILRLVREHAS